MDKAGAVFQNKIYLHDPVNPEVFDPASQEWSGWPKSPSIFGDYPCSLTWRDSFILIGGYANRKAVLQFNHTTQIWNKFDASAISMEVYHSGCAVLPNEEILVVGSEGRLFTASVALYNVKENTWISLGNTTYARTLTSLLTLGNRVFAIGGLGSVVGSNVEEFIVKNNTWVEVGSKLILPRAYHSTLSVPAYLFAHLKGSCKGVH